MSRIKSIYIHIPFCDKICSYCDFCKVYYQKDFVRKYLKVLQKEIKMANISSLIQTIYIGGGTPSCLSYDELEELLKMTQEFKKTIDYEFSIECNFSSLTKEKILLFLKYGVNRLSIGLETTSKRGLSYLNRNLDKRQLEEIIAFAKEKGLTNINLDLIYALPKETISELEDDLDYLLSLKVPHISTYSLMIEEHTKLFLRKVQPISEDKDFMMYKKICERLKNAGYRHYEISNFSLEGYESKHNLVYWQNLEYYGFGVGASGYIRPFRYQNTKSLTKYLEGKTLYTKEEVSKDLEMDYQVMLGLRMRKGINKEKFRKKFQKDFDLCYNVEEIIKLGLLNDTKNSYFIPEEKWYISNEILLRILEKRK